MGIDIYLEWDNQTEKEKKDQCTAFSITSGDVGYLREAYHGSPYATQILVPEAFEKSDVEISFKEMEERLPEVLQVVEERAKKIYNADDEEIEESKQSFSDFVALAKKKEKEKGKLCRVIASY